MSKYQIKPALRRGLIMTRSIKLGGLAIAALLIAAPLGAASAADMAVKAPMKPVPVPYSWTGFYIGVNGGGAQGWTSWQYYTLPGPTPSTAFANHDAAGGMAGGTVGYNWQAGTNWVVGVEGDGDWSQITGSAACPNPVFSCESKIKDIATARGRLGWAEDRVLFYVTGGAAWGDVNLRTVNTAGGPVPPTGTPINGTTSDRLGWTAGGGVEAMIAQTPLSAKLEVLYYDLGSHNFNVDNPAAIFVHGRENGTMVRAGLNWRFTAWK
jgi:outer membrane immunogenic protein